MDKTTTGLERYAKYSQSRATLTSPASLIIPEPYRIGWNGTRRVKPVKKKHQTNGLSQTHPRLTEEFTHIRSGSYSSQACRATFRSTTIDASDPEMYSTHILFCTISDRHAPQHIHPSFGCTCPRLSNASCVYQLGHRSLRTQTRK